MMDYNSRVIYAWSKLLPLLKRRIYSTLYLDTSQKDGLIRDLDALNATLHDLQSRAKGNLPLTPAQAKKNKEAKCRVFPDSVDCKEKKPK